MLREKGRGGPYGRNPRRRRGGELEEIENQMHALAVDFVHHNFLERDTRKRIEAGDVELRVVRAGIDDGYTPEVIWRDGREIARIERAHRLESRRDPAGLGGERYAVPVHYPPGTATWVVTGHPAVDESVMYDATSALMAIARAERDTWDVQ